jgi:crotonobetainyl-CoA:carnitine CoA-transferase CaiB-like acyl-CoA transferase
MPGPSDSLSEESRKEVFAALVAAQDRGVTVESSRWEVAARYGLTSTQVAQIEQEGVDNDWPPL